MSVMVADRAKTFEHFQILRWRASNRLIFGDFACSPSYEVYPAVFWVYDGNVRWSGRKWTQDGAYAAFIAAIRGRMPRMFMTRLRL